MRLLSWWDWRRLLSVLRVWEYCVFISTHTLGKAEILYIKQIKQSGIQGSWKHLQLYLSLQKTEHRSQLLTWHQADAGDLPLLVCFHPSHALQLTPLSSLTQSCSFSWTLISVPTLCPSRNICPHIPYPTWNSGSLLLKYSLVCLWTGPIHQLFLSVILINITKVTKWWVQGYQIQTFS
jgi:hypothetical protein